MEIVSAYLLALVCLIAGLVCCRFSYINGYNEGLGWGFYEGKIHPNDPILSEKRFWDFM